MIAASIGSIFVISRERSQRVIIINFIPFDLIIEVLKKMVKDKSKMMLKKALKMEVKTFSFFNEEQTLEYWSNELDVFLTKVVNIFLFKESFHTKLMEIEYL